MRSPGAPLRGPVCRAARPRGRRWPWEAHSEWPGLSASSHPESPLAFQAPGLGAPGLRADRVSMLTTQRTDVHLLWQKGFLGMSGGWGRSVLAFLLALGKAGCPQVGTSEAAGQGLARGSSPRSSSTQQAAPRSEATCFLSPAARCPSTSCRAGPGLSSPPTAPEQGLSVCTRRRATRVLACMRVPAGSPRQGQPLLTLRPCACPGQCPATLTCGW